MQERVAILFHRFGPYHKARIEAAARDQDVIAIELSRNTDVYSWDAVELDPQIPRITLAANEDSRRLRHRDLMQRLNIAFQKHTPTAVAINGWADNGALAALDLCTARSIPAIVMSDSNQHDSQRTWGRELIKRQLISLFGAGVVAGSLAKSYLHSLGMPEELIYPGYDCVDNHHFSNKPECVSDSSQSPASSRPYFLVVSRLVPKKNLSFVIEAFQKYRLLAKGSPFDLMIVGDGPLQQSLEEKIKALGLENAIHLIGFKQYHEIPALYWGASALIHASLSEQWGLVVNEAMAAGLPVIVSSRCGCVPELVQSDQNGFVFDPQNSSELAAAMEKIDADDALRVRMGKKSREIVSQWSPARFSDAIQRAVIASRQSPHRNRIGGKMMLMAQRWRK